MVHPQMYDDRDPLLHRLSTMALSFPEAQQKVAHGRPTFFTVKVFAYYGGSIKGDHTSQSLSRALLFLPEEDDRQALLEDGRFLVPAYLGPTGWLGLDLAADTPDWDEVRELLDASYRRTAPQHLVAQLAG
ncbi:MmcQ/YjbR family DNA-binding protein [Dermatophilaceae bacterium Sec6.4]